MTDKEPETQDTESPKIKALIKKMIRPAKPATTPVVTGEEPPTYSAGNDGFIWVQGDPRDPK